MIIEQQLLRGIRGSSHITIGTAATSVLLHQIPTGRTSKIRKIMVRNSASADTIVTFWTSASSTGSPATQATPGITVTTGFDLEVPESDLPTDDMTGYIFVQSSNVDSALAGTDIKTEWEESPAGGTPSTT